MTSYYISIFAYVGIYQTSFHLLTHLQRQFCMEIHKFRMPIEIKMYQLQLMQTTVFFCAVLKVINYSFGYSAYI